MKLKKSDYLLALLLLLVFAFTGFQRAESKDVLQLGLLFNTNFMFGPSELTSAPTNGMLRDNHITGEINSAGFGTTMQFGLCSKLKLSELSKLGAMLNYTRWGSITPLGVRNKNYNSLLNLGMSIPGNDSLLQVGTTESYLSLYQFGIGYSFNLVKFNLIRKKMPINIFIQPEVDANLFRASTLSNYSEFYTGTDAETAAYIAQNPTYEWSKSYFRVGATMTAGAEVRVLKQLSAEIGFRFQVPNLLLRQDDDTSTPDSEALIREYNSSSEKLITVFSIQFGVLYNF